MPKVALPSSSPPHFLAYLELSAFYHAPNCLEFAFISNLSVYRSTGSRSYVQYAEVSIVCVKVEVAYLK
jgi:hypothetical protein